MFKLYTGKLIINKEIACVTLALAAIIVSSKAYSQDATPSTQTKRIDLPFVHIGVNRHADGTKDVNVRAPFVHVNNPAGENNAQVRAPFTHVDNRPRAVTPNTTNNATSKTTVTDYNGSKKQKQTVVTKSSDTSQ